MGILDDLNLYLKTIDFYDFNKVYGLAHSCGESIDDLQYIGRTAISINTVGIFSGEQLIAYGIVEVCRADMVKGFLAKFGVVGFSVGNPSIFVGALVHPSYRGSNLQKVLIGEREKYSALAGSDSIFAVVAESARASKENLTQCGYKVIGQRKAASGEVRFLLYKMLS